MDNYVFNASIYKIVLSKPKKLTTYNHGAKTNLDSNETIKDSTNARSYIRVDIARNGGRFQASMHTQKQVFHTNLEAWELESFIDGLFGVQFLQYNAWDESFAYSARVSKKGKILTSRRANAQPPSVNCFKLV